jgi:hypothetical protein
MDPGLRRDDEGEAHHDIAAVFARGQLGYSLEGRDLLLS